MIGQEAIAVKTPRRTPEQLKRHREKQRAYVAKNRDIVNRKQREYSGRPEIKVQRRAYCRARPIEMLLAEARKRAKKKGLPFSLVVDDIHVPQFCPVLGIPLVIGGPRRNWPSLDRLDNRLGYVPGNVFVISHRANNLKGDATAAEVEKILRYMRGHCED